MVNGLYYFVLLCCLLAVNIAHVSIVHPSVYFILHAILQSVLLTVVLAVVGSFFKKVPKLFYIGFTFIVVIIQGIDFVLNRIMAMHFWYALEMIKDETVENFIEMLLLTGLSMWHWIIMFAAGIVIVPLTAIGLYRLTARARWRVERRYLFFPLMMLPFFMLLVDVKIPPKDIYYHHGTTALPFKTTVIPRKMRTVALPNQLARKTEPKLNYSKPKGKLPNIYLFVVESLRDDYLTEATSPNLTSFKRQNIYIEKSYSNANATQLCWYSIFHSNYPFHWQEKSEGSYPIKVLKDMGYHTRVYTSAGLNYYNTDERIFGKDKKNADAIFTYPHYPPVPAADSDEKAFNHFLDDLPAHKHGTVFVIFLDSTHFEYSWPDDFDIKFKPIDRDKTHFRLSSSTRDMKFIKNRYKNSINFVDMLMGSFFGKLKRMGLYDESLIVFTGDHGDEFYEAGQLFHASHLSEMQTKPPIYFKLGDNTRYKPVERVSHVDIMPTVIDHLVSAEIKGIDGRSLYSKNRLDYIISARYNGSRPPFEFYIHHGDQKCIARFSNRSDIFSATHVNVVSIKNTKDQFVSFEKLSDFIPSLGHFTRPSY
ncbi:MAG: hypothetical protein SP1CHLAM54_08350 [Chlamydiia bacterium]|nr:hypothetical protein [Chlamydiia bacterium]MCH9615741.1 hypothetical protein [Chlamydiia bacterium]MCH9628856.1 hypothetical protein [Chlamydiia bacterium]